jgi:hypothetical protein
MPLGIVNNLTVKLILFVKINGNYLVHVGTYCGLVKLFKKICDVNFEEIPHVRNAQVSIRLTY